MRKGTKIAGLELERKGKYLLTSDPISSECDLIPVLDRSFTGIRCD